MRKAYRQFIIAFPGIRLRTHTGISADCYDLEHESKKDRRRSSIIFKRGISCSLATLPAKRQNLTFQPEHALQVE
jgi:hypothetical protein